MNRHDDREKTRAGNPTPDRGMISAVLTRTAILDENVFSAEDVIAGLRKIPGFVFAYAVPPNSGSDQKTEVVGIFAAASGELQPGQRRVWVPPTP